MGKQAAFRVYAPVEPFSRQCSLRAAGGEWGQIVHERTVYVHTLGKKTGNERKSEKWGRKKDRGIELNDRKWLRG